MSQDPPPAVPPPAVPPPAVPPAGPPPGPASGTPSGSVWNTTSDDTVFIARAGADPGAGQGAGQGAGPGAGAGSGWGAGLDARPAEAVPPPEPQSEPQFGPQPGWQSGPPLGAVRHAYPLAVRDPSFGTAVGLLMQSLPYAAIRFAVLFVSACVAIVWLCIAVGGAAWLGTHVATVFGWAWFILCALGTGFFWGTVLRYGLHLIECGHVAVLTELVTKGAVGNGAESMFAYGRRVVTERFGQVTMLFGLNALVRGVLAAFHRTLDFVAELLPVPGLDTISSLLTTILRAATRYVDKVVFSYILARGGEEPGRAAREGLVYYAQNARPILKTALWAVALDWVLTAVLCVLLMVPASAFVLLLPASVREGGALVTLAVAALCAACLRAAFIKPVFLIMMMVRFHAAAEGQPINAAWDDTLAGVSDKFRTLGQGVADAFRPPARA